jgi:hypothetical protein
MNNDINVLTKAAMAAIVEHFLCFLFCFVSKTGQLKMRKISILSFHALLEKQWKFCHIKAVFGAKSSKIRHSKTFLKNMLVLCNKGIKKNV